MIRRSSGKSVDDWMALFIRRLERQVEAERAEDVRRYNRLHTGVAAAFPGILDQGPRGRDGVEALLGHTLPKARLRAGLETIKWARKRPFRFWRA